MDAGGGPAVLIVDDDEKISRLLVRILEPHGYRCVVTNDPAEARDKLIDGPFALLLTDMLMPGETGLSLAKYVVTQYQETAVIMVTVLGDPRIAEAPWRSVPTATSSNHSSPTRSS